MKDYAPVCLRVVVGLYLYTALKAKVYLPSVASKFSEQLENLNFPFPLFMAYLGTWALLLSYIALVVGYKVRWAAIPMIIYFAVALLTYHLPEQHSIRESMPAIVLMVLGCFFLMNGAGRPSVDEGL